jgi:hypothetical protein
MTLKLSLSQVKSMPFDFEAAVQDFIGAKKHHQSTDGEPAPSARHQMVEAAVKRVPGSIDPPRPDDFVADYEIVDDTPPQPSLDQRKAVLVAALGTAANAAIAAVIPPLKRRLWDLEQHRIAVLLNGAKLESVKDETPEARRARALATLSADDLAHYLAHEARNKKIDAIVYQVAKAESAIHDLTEETLPTWKPPAFPS